jgi:ARG/rhodanese/phosphatase superfamily protein
MKRSTELNTAQTVIDAIQSVSFGAETTFQNLTVVPILRACESQSDYLTLDEALARGSIEITEVSEAGHVPELKVLVKGPVPVLLLDGEELVGAKQNRVLNLTILAPAHRATTIPVSCVESGRWRRSSRGFTAAPRAQFAEGRAAKMGQVTASLMSDGARRSDQGAVWNLIAEKSARLEARSATSAMSAVFEKLDAPIEEFVRAFDAQAGQVGAVFLVDGAPVGLELFDAPATWRKLGPKLIRSYAVDALDRARKQGAHSQTSNALAFVDAIASAPASVFPAAGEGEDIRLIGETLQGAALVARGRALHVSAFVTSAGQSA